MYEKAVMPPAGEAILAGDLEKMRCLIEDGSLLFRNGEIVRLHRDIPKIVGGETLYTDAFDFALDQNQTEIVHLLIDHGLVDLSPNGDAMFVAIRRGDFVLLNYMLDHGGQFGRTERDITRLILNLSDVWDEHCPALLDRLKLPVGTLGGTALCHIAGENRVSVAEYLLGAGVDINSRDSSQDTPVLRAAAEGHTDMVRYLVERGADITVQNEYGLRPYTAARQMDIWTQLRLLNLWSRSERLRTSYRMNCLSSTMYRRLCGTISRTDLCFWNLRMMSARAGFGYLPIPMWRRLPMTDTRFSLWWRIVGITG